MLEINIDKNYRIANDNYNFILQCKRTVTGENTVGKQANPENIGQERWEDEGYYRTIRSLLEGYCRIKTLKSNAKTFEELFKELKEIEMTIKEIKDIGNLIDMNVKAIKSNSQNKK